MDAKTKMTRHVWYENINVMFFRSRFICKSLAVGHYFIQGAATFYVTSYEHKSLSNILIYELERKQQLCVLTCTMMKRFVFKVYFTKHDYHVKSA